MQGVGRVGKRQQINCQTPATRTFLHIHSSQDHLTLEILLRRFAKMVFAKKCF